MSKPQGEEIDEDKDSMRSLWQNRWNLWWIIPLHQHICLDNQKNSLELENSWLWRCWNICCTNVQRLCIPICKLAHQHHRKFQEDPDTLSCISSSQWQPGLQAIVVFVFRESETSGNVPLVHHRQPKSMVNVIRNKWRKMPKQCPPVMPTYNIRIPRPPSKHLSTCNELNEYKNSYK